MTTSKIVMTREVAASHATIRAREVHLSHRSNWLRAAVLGANDGILSTSSIVLGVAGDHHFGDWNDDC